MSCNGISTSSSRLLLRTVRHLYPSQIAWRAIYRALRRVESLPWFALPRRLQRRLSDLEIADDLPLLPVFRPCAVRGRAHLSELSAGQLTLLNVSRGFQGGADWCMFSGRRQQRLWNHALHYHRWLCDIACGFAETGEPQFAKELADQLNDWLDVCRPGAPGFAHYCWNSFAIATRLIYWLQLLQLLPPSFFERHRQLGTRLLDSFACQAAYLHGHIEWDLRGNHLLRDAVGLACAGRLFRGPASQRWLQRATRLAIQQIDEQILHDGGHFERSPMYHVHVMEDVLCLASLLRDESARHKLHRAWERMAEFLAWVRHPDGEIPLLNDAAQGAASRPQDMLALGQSLGIPVDAGHRQGGRWFSDFGLFVWHGAAWTVFFDLGVIGPDYQPGHAHADTLSLECSFQGTRLFVDPGTYGYDNDERRAYDRSTEAHNTVCVDRANSSEVWHIFRVGRRARPLAADVRLTPGGFLAAGSHDGYLHLPGRPRHRRMVALQDGCQLEVVDQLEGGGNHEASGGWLLAPGWKALADEGGWILSHQDLAALRVTMEGSQPLRLSRQTRCLHPRFGVEDETTRLTWSWRGHLPLEVRTTVQVLRFPGGGCHMARQFQSPTCSST